MKSLKVFRAEGCKRNLDSQMYTINRWKQCSFHLIFWGTPTHYTLNNKTTYGIYGINAPYPNKDFRTEVSLDEIRFMTFEVDLGLGQSWTISTTSSSLFFIVVHIF